MAVPASRIDLRDLEPPEPLMRVLAQLESEPEGPHVFLLSRAPFLLYPMLARDGWHYRLDSGADGFELTVFREPRGP